MTWQTEITPMVRYLIGDVSDTPTYSDARLQNTILIAAQLMSKEVNFDTIYTIDISNSGISPDPTTTRDDNFITLSALKSACIIAKSELRTYGLTGMKVTDGPSSIDTTGIGSNLKNSANSACEAYSQALKQYMLGNGVGFKIITGPYTQYHNSPYNTFLGG